MILQFWLRSHQRDSTIGFLGSGQGSGGCSSDRGGAGESRHLKKWRCGGGGDTADDNTNYTYTYNWTKVRWFCLEQFLSAAIISVLAWIPDLCQQLAHCRKLHHTDWVFTACLRLFTQFMTMTHAMMSFQDILGCPYFLLGWNKSLQDTGMVCAGPAQWKLVNTWTHAFMNTHNLNLKEITNVRFHC